MRARVLLFLRVLLIKRSLAPALPPSFIFSSILVVPRACECAVTLAAAICFINCDCCALKKARRSVAYAYAVHAIKGTLPLSAAPFSPLSSSSSSRWRDRGGANHASVKKGTQNGVKEQCVQRIHAYCSHNSRRWAERRGGVAGRGGSIQDVNAITDARIPNVATLTHFCLITKAIAGFNVSLFDLLSFLLLHLLLLIPSIIDF